MNNFYGETIVPPNVPTIVLAVPIVSPIAPYSFKGIIAHSDVVITIEIRVNQTVVVSGRNSGANPTLVLDYSYSPYDLMPGNTIYVFATQEDIVPHEVACTLLGNQL